MGAAPAPPVKGTAMIINSETLDLAFRGFKTVHTDAFEAAPAFKDRIAMTVPSTSRDETYGWLGQFPQLREWIGPRHVKNLTAHGFTIQNRKFEATIAVKRDDIADDKLGLFKPMFSEMGQASRRHPEELVFSLLKPEAKLSGPVPAAGWIKDLKAEPSGIWGRVEWTATARELIRNREYRYLSPSFLFHPKTQAIMKLKGAGLPPGALND